MRAKALICHDEQTFTYEDVILPDPGPEHIVVRTLYSGVSIGTEFAQIRNKLTDGLYPVNTGYQAVGVVEQAGDGVRQFKVGDKVYFRDNRWIELPDGRKVAAEEGTHCSLALIDPHDTSGVGLVPEGVDDAVASLIVMPAVGLQATDMTSVRLGNTVAVHGSGLIGLGAVAACSHRGAVVIAIDLQHNRLELARRFGADYVINASTQDVQQEVEKIVPNGADVVFEATGIPACVDIALGLCRTRGKFVFLGNYGRVPLALRFLVPHHKRLAAFFPCGDGLAPCRRAVLKNMALGVLPWHLAITHRVEAKDTVDFYTAINEGRAKDVLGAVIRWS
jgi:2-desacetyl-2-hydroxyethyl bacteriochlorophyllide A dehydrogenase